MKHLRLFESFDSLDFKSVDMKKDFDMLNDKMFGGEIKRVPVRWMSTKYKLGVMAFNENGEIEYVAISNFYKITRQQFLDILAHEMIHIWMEQKGMREKDPHGQKFMTKMEELNKRFPEFSIRKSENVSDYNIAGSGVMKEYGVVLFDEDGRYSLVVVNSKVMDDDAAINEFIEGIRKYGLHKFRKLKISMYKSSNPDLPKFKIKKSLSLRSLELFVLTPELAKEIQQDELVKEAVLK